MSVILVEAKKEYTEQIVGFLRPAIYDDFFVIWRTAVEKNTKEPMVVFQELLETIVDWDEKTVLRKTDLVIKKSGCSFLDDLITAVFVAHMKVMLTVKNKNQKDKYRLQVPTSNRFIHQTMIQCAREFWKAPYLFYQNETENKIKKTQIQMNLRTAEDIIGESIHTTIRKMLPVKEIVGDVLEYDENGELIVDIEKRVEYSDSPSSDEDNSNLEKKLSESSTASSGPIVAQQDTAPATPISGTIGPIGPTDSSQSVNRRFENPLMIELTQTQDGGDNNKVPTNNMIGGGENEDDDSDYEPDGFVMGPIDDEIEIISDNQPEAQDIIKQKEEILGNFIESL